MDLDIFFAQPSDPECSHGYINTLRDEWRQVFILAAEIYVAGALIYIILASGKVQPWAINDVTTTSSTNSVVIDDDETSPLLSESEKINYYSSHDNHMT